jgi:alpha-galactosidase
MKHLKISVFYLLSVSVILTFTGCSKVYRIRSGDLLIEYNSDMYARVNSEAKDARPLTGGFQLSEYLETKNLSTDKFRVYGEVEDTTESSFGKGHRTLIRGQFTRDGICLDKIVEITTYDDFPGIALFRVSYVNCGDQVLKVHAWVNNNYQVLAGNDKPAFWSFQGSSSSERTDWILPLKPGFYKKNYMGMNDTDYGGGIPVTDLWRKDGGIAIGHTATVPKEVSLPVDFDIDTTYTRIGIEKEFKDYMQLAPGDSLKTLETFVMVHQGDYFSALRLFSEIMEKKGIVPAKSEDEAFEPIWCGWGYMRNFTLKEILGTLPKVKELGIKWAVIDDGYQVAEGDWNVNRQRFPGGNADMRRLVEAIHSYGLKAKLWWAPLAADPGSKILKEEPNVLLRNADDSPEYITWWDSYYMSPAKKSTIDYTRQTVKMFLEDWGFDGLKMDGQHMNAVPPDYSLNGDPEESVESLPGFFKMIYKTARGIKPHAVLENCPCGCCMSFYNMPWTNQFVASDPTSSWQIRLKGKTYKALMPHTAYYGDHVELSDGGDDFASSFGIGAVLGTKFTWPKDNPTAEGTCVLTPEKEIAWKKWFSLYNERMLSKGEYKGALYDIGYDIPETHVIQTGDTLNYAFYAKDWDGDVSFRGLQNRSYKLVDYYNGTALGQIEGPSATRHLAFKNFMLVEAIPE